MADFIKLKRTDAQAVLVQDLLALPAQLRAWIDRAQKIRDTGFRMGIGDTPATFTEFETNYGIPTSSGQTVFDQIAGILGALDGTMQNSQAIEFINRVG